MSLYPVTREDPVSLTCARIFLVGSSGVGKSSLLRQYLHGEFSSEYHPTVEETVHSQQIVLNNTDYQMRIIDTVGTEDLSDNYESAHYEDTSAVEDCFLFCFAVDDRDSFLAVNQAIFHLSQLKNTPVVHLPAAIVGCKSDNPRAVSPLEIKQITCNHQLAYHETSARTNHLVSEVFGQIMRLFLDKQKQAMQRSKKEAMNLSLVDACACHMIRPKIIKRKLSIGGATATINTYTSGQSPLQAALRRPASKERRYVIQMLLRMNADPFQGPENEGKGESVIEWLLKCRNLDGMGELLSAGMSHDDLASHCIDGKLVVEHIIDGDFARFSSAILRFIIQCVVDNARLASRVCRRMDHDAIELGQRIGCGSFGKVYQGRVGGESVAIKQIDESLHPNDSAFDLAGLRRELAILSLIQSPHLIRFLGYSYHEPHYYLVTELADGSLHDYLMDGRLRALDWTAKEKIAQEICRGMIVLHHNGIAHRDLKTENILIVEKEGELVPKIADFGISRDVHSRTSFQTRSVGTKHYMAPELMESEKVLADTTLLKADVFSFGYILWAIYSNVEPYDGSSEADIQRSLDATRRKGFFSSTGKTPLKISSSCPRLWKQVMTACWQYAPAERPSFRLILAMLEGESKKALKQIAEKEEEFAMDCPDKGRSASDSSESDYSPMSLQKIPTSGSGEGTDGSMQFSESSSRSEESEEIGGDNNTPTSRGTISSTSSTLRELSQTPHSSRFYPKSNSSRAPTLHGTYRPRSAELHDLRLGLQQRKSTAVDAWLDSHGFAAYKAVFQKHEIDMEDLPDLTRDDLWRMDIQKVGVVLKILRAVRQDPRLAAE